LILKQIISYYKNVEHAILYSLFFPGRRVRAHLQNPATKCDFPIGYFFSTYTREMCNITVFCTVNEVQAAIFVSSCLSSPFVFCVVSVYLL
jgi:hypothetical protein